MITLSGEEAPVSVAAGFGHSRRAYTLIYDGTCGVCTRMVKVLENWDRSHVLEIIPSQARGTRERFPWIPASAYADSMQLIRASDGRTWQSAAALEELINVLPKGRVFSWLFNVPFARPLADRFYWWFARNRYRMSCGEHCAARALEGESRVGEGESK